CAIKCGKDQVGTLHAMPLFYHVYDKDPDKAKIVKAGSPDATGIGSALHFIQSGKSKDCDCQSFRIIQVVETTHNPGEPRGGSIVDIYTAEAHEQKKQGGGDTTPYYGDYAKNKKHLG